MPIGKCSDWVKCTNVFWHNHHACFSLMSQGGDFQPDRTGLSNHQMCSILVRGIYLMDHLNSRLCVSDDANTASFSLRAGDALCAHNFVKSWVRTWKGIFKWEYISWLIYRLQNKIHFQQLCESVEWFYFCSAQLADRAAFLFSSYS